MLHCTRILHPLTGDISVTVKSWEFKIQPENTFFHLPSYSSCLHYSAMSLSRTTVQYLLPIAGQVHISILLLLFCSFITLFSFSLVFCKFAAPPHSPPRHTPSPFPHSCPFGSLPCSSCPSAVLRSLFFWAPSLQSRADIGQEVREMGSHAPAVSRLKWAQIQCVWRHPRDTLTSLGLWTSIHAHTQDPHIQPHFSRHIIAETHTRIH